MDANKIPREPFAKPRPQRTISFPPPRTKPQHLSLGGPDGLDEAIALGKAVESVIALTHGTDETAEGVDVVLAGDSAAVLVNLGDGDLDGGVVLGLDDAVGGAALARNVAGEANMLANPSLCLFILHRIAIPGLPPNSQS